MSVQWLEQFDIPAGDRAVLRSAIFFEPLPCVQRVVFVATPHQGSFLSEGLIRTMANWLISIPKRTLNLTQDIVTKNVALLKPNSSEMGLKRAENP